LFPILFLVSAAFGQGTMTGNNRLFSTFSWANFASLTNHELYGSQYWGWLRNSLVIAIVTSIGTVLMGAAASYAFSRFRFYGRRFGLTALLIIQMFPQMLAFVAVFLLVLSLGQVFPILGFNSVLTLICIYWGGALGANTFLMYGFFNTIPKELDEAAKMDGATHSQIYWGIIFRLVVPILAIVGLLSFTGVFGEFILASLILPNQANMTVAVGLNMVFGDGTSPHFGFFVAGATLAAIPVVVLFLFLQKYIVGGLTAGSVKG
jgi:arabinogalactan oligomer/maltooligosaccharide transport system permease protein